MKRAKRRDRIALLIRNNLPQIATRAITRAFDETLIRIVANGYGIPRSVIEEKIAELRATSI